MNGTVIVKNYWVMKPQCPTTIFPKCCCSYESHLRVRNLEERPLNYLIFDTCNMFFHLHPEMLWSMESLEPKGGRSPNCPLILTLMNTTYKSKVYYQMVTSLPIAKDFGSLKDNHYVSM